MVKRVIDADYLISYMEYAINSCHYEKTLIDDNLTVADVIRALIKDIEKMADALYKPTNNKKIPTVEAIPKADYENRLKADKVAMLKDLQLEIEEMSNTIVEGRTTTVISWVGMQKKICNLIQQKIDKLKEVEK